MIIAAATAVIYYCKKTKQEEINRPEVILTEANRHTEAADYSGLFTKPSSTDELKSWSGSVNLGGADLSELDLSNYSALLDKLCFNTNTKWTEQLPSGFDPQKIMQDGKNPGLGINALHNDGVLGTGVNIAIVDYALYSNHTEYKNQLKYYAEVNAAKTPEMHGGLVSSLAVGSEVGVAPEANLYFVGSNNISYQDEQRTFNFNNFAEAIDGIVTLNKTLPEEQKIRVISASFAWTPESTGGIELSNAIKNALQNDIMVFS